MENKFEENIPEWIFNAKILDYKHKDELTNDRYKITITELKRDIKDRIIDSQSTTIKAVLFPFELKKKFISYDLNTAGFIEENGKINCNMNLPGRRNAFILKSDKHEFVGMGRWDEEDGFISNISSVLDENPNFIVDTQVEKHNGKGKPLYARLGKYEFYCMPIYYKNSDSKVAFLAVIKNRSSEEYAVAVAKDILKFKEFKLACYWDENIIKLYQLR